MSKLKAVFKAVERAEPAVKIQTRAAASEARALEDLSESLGGFRAAETDDVVDLDMDMLDNAIQQEALRSFEQERISGISSKQPKSIDLRHQAQSVDEFKQRVSQQLYTPEYGAMSVNHGLEMRMQKGMWEPEDVARHMAEDQFWQESIRGKLYRDPRYEARAKEITKDSAYGDRIFFHQEAWTAPDGKLPQFGDNPNEIGLHSGTNQAAWEAAHPGKPTPEQYREKYKDFDEDIEMLEGALGMPKGELEAEVYDALKQYFEVNFSKGGTDVQAAKAFDEVGKMMADKLKEAGQDPAAGGMLLARLRSLRTSSAVPHYFNGKNGLVLRDDGGFNNEQVIQQLMDIFPDDRKALESIEAASRSAKPRQIQHFIESKGYDHVAYINTAEDVGTVSIINWNEDLMIPIWDARVAGDGVGKRSTAAAQYLLGMIGFGSAALQSEE